MIRSQLGTAIFSNIFKARAFSSKTTFPSFKAAYARFTSGVLSIKAGSKLSETPALYKDTFGILKVFYVRVFAPVSPCVSMLYSTFVSCSSFTEMTMMPDEYTADIALTVLTQLASVVNPKDKTTWRRILQEDAH